MGPQGTEVAGQDVSREWARQRGRAEPAKTEMGVRFGQARYQGPPHPCKVWGASHAQPNSQIPVSPQGHQASLGFPKRPPWCLSQVRPQRGGIRDLRDGNKPGSVRTKRRTLGAPDVDTVPVNTGTGRASPAFSRSPPTSDGARPVPRTGRWSRTPPLWPVSRPAAMPEGPQDAHPATARPAGAAPAQSPAPTPSLPARPHAQQCLP